MQHLGDFVCLLVIVSCSWFVSCFVNCLVCVVVSCVIHSFSTMPFDFHVLIYVCLGFSSMAFLVFLVCSFGKALFL